MTLVALVPLVLVPAGAMAQEAGSDSRLEILGAEYDHSSAEVLLNLRADGSRERSVDNLTVLIEDVPHSASTPSSEDVPAPAVLLAIDTSGSMLGAPIASASAAGIAFVDKLAAGDTVGLLTFSNAPRLLVPPSEDAGAVRFQLGSLFADGNTALHDAIVTSLDVLAGTGAERRALVLLSDGEESGVSAATSEDVVSAIDTSGVQVYAFALGAGADRAFLADIATRSGGAIWEVADDGALEEVFAALGGRLGASSEIRISTPGLTVGTHEIEVRARIDGVVTSSTYTLEVTPPALILGEPVYGAVGDPIDVAVSGVPAGASLIAELDGAVMSGSANRSSIALDPWLFGPGDYVLDVRAEQSGNVVASASTAVRIPELTPTLRVTPPSADGAPFEATLRWQGAVAPTLLAVVDGAEVARSADGALSVLPAEGAQSLEFRAVGADGTVLAQAEESLSGSVVSSAAPLGVLLVLLAALGGGAFWWLRRRRRAALPSQPEFRAVRRPLSVTRGTPSASGTRDPRTLAAPAGRVVLTNEFGEVRIVPVGPRPLTLGADDTCDIAVPGPGVRAQHARLAMTAGGDLRIHGLSGSGARPYEGGVAEQWLTLHHGDEIAIGSWSIRFDAQTPHEEAS